MLPCVGCAPVRLTTIKVKMAPSGAAHEKISRRFRIAGVSSPRHNNVVVSPRAVGPVKSARCDHGVRPGGPLWTKTARKTMRPRLPFPLRLLAPRAIPSAAPWMTMPRVALSPATAPVDDLLLWASPSWTCSRLGMIGVPECRWLGAGRPPSVDVLREEGMSGVLGE